MNPIDYSIDVENPFKVGMAGFQAGQQQKLAQQQLEQQQAAQKQLQSDLYNLSVNKNAGAQDYAALMTRYPQLSEHFKRSWDVLNADQQQNRLTQSAQVFSALQSGQNDVAIDLLSRQAEALRNSGRDADAAAADTMMQLIQKSPETAKTSTGAMLAAIMGADKFGATFGQIGAEQRAQEKQPAEIKKANAEATVKENEAQTSGEKFLLENANVRSQINERAKRLGLDQDKLTSEVQLKLTELGQKANQLDDNAKKIVNDSTMAAVTADQSANQMNDLATRLEDAALKSGATAKAAELYKSLTGNQDAVTQLRQEYVRLRSQGVLKNLPPGPASDKDVEMAAKGFPEDTAEPKQMAQFLRGLAKIQQLDSVNKTAQAEWVNAVGHMGKPKADIEVDGVKVPAGSTFTDFAKKFFKQKTEEKAAGSAVQAVQNRSYMKYANPGA